MNGSLRRRCGTPIGRTAAILLFSLAVLLSFSGCLDSFQKIANPYYDIDAVYSLDSKTSYFLKYGYSVTNYDGTVNITLPLPKGAAHSAGGKVEYITVAGNPVIRWTFSEEGTKEFSVSVSGAGTLGIFKPKNATIHEAGAAHPEYLKDQHLINGKGESCWLIMPSNLQIKSAALGIAGAAGNGNAFTAAKSIFKWLKESTRYEFSSDPIPKSAVRTLAAGGGDCDDLSFLYISLCRAAGIPARFVTGYVLSNDTAHPVEPHAWVEFYDGAVGAGQWVPVEVAGSGGGAEALKSETDTHFAVRHPDHVAVFTDDGSNASMSIYSGIESRYHENKPVIEQLLEGTIETLSAAKLVVYKDGRREIKPMDWEPKVSFSFW